MVFPRAAAARSMAALCIPSSWLFEETRTYAEDVPVDPLLVPIETHTFEGVSDQGSFGTKLPYCQWRK
jgi:hypothetical protein